MKSSLKVVDKKQEKEDVFYRGVNVKRFSLRTQTPFNGHACTK